MSGSRRAITVCRAWAAGSTWPVLWNSLSSIGGMFGQGWKSTYEETLTGPDPEGNLKYWRSDGSAWTFTPIGTAGYYNLSSPPNVRASLYFDSVGGQYYLTFADGT